MGANEVKTEWNASVGIVNFVVAGEKIIFALT